MAWERLVTVQGSEIEGDVSQQEFVLIDKSGGEVAIPRAALLRFEAGEDGLRALIKDGTTVEGTLQGKFEIGDGLIKRRYSADEIQTVEFDRYIEPQTGKQYQSCPIRVQLELHQLLNGKGGRQGAGGLSSVSCNEMRMSLGELSVDGKVKPGKTSTMTAKITVAVPPGEDQRLDFQLTLMQGEAALSKRHQVVVGDEGEFVATTVAMKFPGASYDPAGPKPRLLVQLVSQDEKRKVEKGSYFWWFTFPIPVG
ncbi:MAG: hypothetical protein ABI689_07780 [Thermoanaerobaculia bacterium]